MKIRGLIVAALVFLALAGILYWSEHRKPDETAKAATAAPPAILKLDEASVIKLEIKKAETPPLLLSRVASGDWQITEPKALGADQSGVSSVVSTLSSLDSQRLVDEKAGDLKPYGLDQPAVEVESPPRTTSRKKC